MTRLAIGLQVTTHEESPRHFGLQIRLDTGTWREFATPAVIIPSFGKWAAFPGANFVRLTNQAGTINLVRLDGLDLYNVAEGDTGSCQLDSIGTTGEWICDLITTG